MEGHYLVAVANNIRHYAGGMSVLSPEALLDDGEMDMWLLSGNNVADALRHFFDLVAGRHLTSDQARRLPFHNARVESDAAFAIQVDGDPVLGGQQSRDQDHASRIESAHAKRCFVFIEKPKEINKWT